MTIFSVYDERGRLAANQGPLGHENDLGGPIERRSMRNHT